MPRVMTSARVTVKGNRIKADVVVYAARAGELQGDWLREGRADDSQLPPLRRLIGATPSDLVRGAASGISVGGLFRRGHCLRRAGARGCRPGTERPRCGAEQPTYMTFG
jgi:hypothetical protein